MGSSTTKLVERRKGKGWRDGLKRNRAKRNGRGWQELTVRPVAQAGVVWRWKTDEGGIIVRQPLAKSTEILFSSSSGNC